MFYLTKNTQNLISRREVLKFLHITLPASTLKADSFPTVFCIKSTSVSLENSKEGMCSPVCCKNNLN